ncbi:MAG: transposase [Bryobacterales bacterium]|nr:transposase [Bryobacterales bacterium]
MADRVADDTTVYTAEASAYQGMAYEHQSVRHGTGEYVRGEVHTNGIESFWAMLKRAHKGTFHKISPKHPHRYVNEFAGKHNIRDQDTQDQMQSVVAGMNCGVSHSSSTTAFLLCRWC